MLATMCVSLCLCMCAYFWASLCGKVLTHSTLMTSSADINIAQKINEVTKEQDFAQNLTIEQGMCNCVSGMVSRPFLRCPLLMTRFDERPGRIVHTDILMGENEKGVLDYIEELINRQDKLSRVLRLLCLWSCVGNGLKAKTYDFFRKEIMQTYGYESILTLYNLEKLGMLKKQEGSVSLVKEMVSMCMIFALWGCRACVCRCALESEVIRGKSLVVNDPPCLLAQCVPVRVL